MKNANFNKNIKFLAHMPIVFKKFVISDKERDKNKKIILLILKTKFNNFKQNLKTIHTKDQKLSKLINF